MVEIKRYAIGTCREDPHGPMVRHDDHVAALNAIEAQNEWLKDTLADLGLPPSSHQNIEEWLIERGMPSLSPSSPPTE